MCGQCSVNLNIRLHGNQFRVLESLLWTDGRIDTGEIDFVSSRKRKCFDTFGMPYGFHCRLSHVLLV